MSAQARLENADAAVLELSVTRGRTQAQFAPQGVLAR